MSDIYGFRSRGKGRKRKVYPLTESRGLRMPKDVTIEQQYRKALKRQASLTQWAQPQKPTAPKRKLYEKDTYVYGEGPLMGGKERPYRVVKDKGGFVTLAEWNFAMGRETTFEVPRHAITGKAKAPEPHMGGVVSYNKATGWMRISFPEKPPEHVRAGMKSQGFRYKPRSKTWSAKWNTERQDFAEALVGKMTEVDIKPNWQRKAEYAESQALKHHKESDERFDRTWKSLEAIPPGQPILVGHHSEKSHRAHLKRIDKGFEIARREKKIAEKYQDRAKRYRSKAVGEPPGLIYRRIQKLEAEERGWKRSIKQLISFAAFEKTYPQLAEKRGIKGDPTEMERCKRYLARTQELLKNEREKYNASGGIFTDKVKLKKGDLVRTQVGVATVVKVNPKTVTVKTKNGWDLKLDKSNIYGKVE